MKILVLGGAGSVGRKICEIGTSKDHCITSVDIHSTNIVGVRSIKADILDIRSLKKVISKVDPNTIINCLNLATIYSKGSSNRLREIIDFHVGLYMIFQDLKPIHYIQIGTTGTGGMGINAPFSHGEELSKLPLFYKASFAGICTSLLTLLSRSFEEIGARHRFSEIKPGLAIFQDAYTEQEEFGCTLITSDGGENGRYTYNELAILTAFMGFTTAQKIAEKTFSIIKQEKKEVMHKSFDVIDSLNHTIVSQDQEDITIRNLLLKRMAANSHDKYIITTGNLGPPSLIRDLILSHLLINNKGEMQTKQVFEKSKKTDISFYGTLAYIKKINIELYRFLNNELDYNNYLNLSKYVKNSMKPWEVVRNQLSARV